MAGPFQRIVVAYDGSPQGRMALESAIDLAQGWGASLTLITVYQVPIIWAVGPVLPVPPEEAGREDAEETLRKGVDRARERGISHVRGVFREGHPSEEILHLLEEEHADLVVMGSRGQSEARRLLLGSVSDAVIHHAHTAVLVIRPLGAGRA